MDGSYWCAVPPGAAVATGRCQGGSLSRMRRSSRPSSVKIEEEAGVTAEVEGILGLRNRCDPDVGNSLYIVLLLHPLSGDPKPDGKEVDRAEYFSLDEIH